MQFDPKDYDDARCDKYRALSLFQPWAKYATVPFFHRDGWEALFPIIFVAKYTDYRGDLLICSAGPEGQTAGLVEVYDCIPAQQLAEDEWAKACAMKSERKKMAKRFALFTRNPRRVIEYPAKGEVGKLWEYVCPKGELMEYPRIVKLGADGFKKMMKGK